MLLDSALLDTALLDDDEVGGAGPGGPGGSGGFNSRFVNGLDVDLMLGAAGYQTFARVRIADPAGVLRDYSTRDSINWIEEVSYEQTIDAPIATATVRLLRESVSKSLAPFRTNSNYNTIPYVAADLTQGVGPSIDVGRRILIDAAAVPLGSDPDAIEESDWHLVFEGIINNVDDAASPVVVECSDKGVALQDTWFPVPNTIAPDPANIQGALAELLDLAHLDVAVPLYVPIAPDPEVVVGSFKYDIEPAMDALQRIAQINGWDLRERFSDFTQQFELTFKDPGRDQENPVFVIYPKSYIDVTQHKMDRTGVRNDITVNYGPDDAKVSVNEYSPESVRRYGRRSMVITEAADSPIQTEESARRMAQLILFDLGEPMVEKQIEMLYFWPFEPHNLVRFPANLVHSDESIDLSLYAVRHTIKSEGESRTQATFRGRPGGSYWGWFLRKPPTASGVPDGTFTPTSFTDLAQAPDFGTDHVQLLWAWGGDPSATFDVYVQQGTGGFFLEDSGLSVTSLDYDTGTDIEPFHPPPDPPQVPIYVSFYIVAHVTGLPDVTSPISNGTYGFGP